MRRWRGHGPRWRPRRQKIVLGDCIELKKEKPIRRANRKEKKDSNGTEMALVVARRGIARHGSVACISGSDGTDLILIYLVSKPYTLI